jgi:hypothetical protein
MADERQQRAREDEEEDEEEEEEEEEEEAAELDEEEDEEEDEAADLDDEEDNGDGAVGYEGDGAAGYAPDGIDDDYDLDDPDDVARRDAAYVAAGLTPPSQELGPDPARVARRRAALGK